MDVISRSAGVARTAIPSTMSEAELQTEVIRLARSLGWGTTLSARKAMLAECAAYRVEPPPIDGLAYHPRYSLGSEPGWPDLTLVRRDDRRLLFVELKAEKGVLSVRQSEVLDLLGCLESDAMLDHPGLGLEPLADFPTIGVHVWRPSDLTSGAIAEVLS